MKESAASLLAKLEDKQREYEDLLVEHISAGTSPIRYPDGVLPVEVVVKMRKLRQEVAEARRALLPA